MRLKTVVVLLVLLLVTSAVAIGAGAVWPHLRDRESTEFADVAWQTGGAPMTVVVTIRDPAGAPVSGVAVYVVNNSGGNSEWTDAHGVATLQMGEPEMEALEIDGMRVVHRPFAYYLGRPDVTKGLDVAVLLKPVP